MYIICMYVCMYVYRYVCMHICMHIVYVCMYVFKYSQYFLLCTYRAQAPKGLWRHSDNTLHPSHRPFRLTTVCLTFAAIPICLLSRPTRLSSFYSVFSFAYHIWLSSDRTHELHLNKPVVYCTLNSYTLSKPTGSDYGHLLEKIISL